MTCIAVLFPQVRQLIIKIAERIMHRETSLYEVWHKALLSYAMGGIFLIIVSGYCLLIDQGKTLVRKVRYEIRDCLIEIDWHSLIKTILLMFGIYLLGVLSLIRANFLYNDDVARTIMGFRVWYNGSRYVSEFLSIFVHADFHLTNISPFPQLLAILFLAISSALLVYVLNNKKITTIGLIASVPLGLSPYMLACLSYQFDSPYMALSVLSSIIPFLFLARKKAFVLLSVISLLIMCMTYQASSGIYLLITLALCFYDWNDKRKVNRENLLFLGRSVLSFGIAMVIFKLFLMRPYISDKSISMLPFQQMIPGISTNLLTYVKTLNSDFSLIWKVIIGVILCSFIFKSVLRSAQNKMISLIVIFLLLGMLFLLSFSVSLLLDRPLFDPRTMYGFGVFLAIISIYITSNFNKITKITAFALSWSFFIFAFSYGNALADHIRYVNFRTSILLQDLSALYPDRDNNTITIQLKNTIGFTPAVRSIGKRNPVIYRLIPQMLRESDLFSYIYILSYSNYAPLSMSNLYYGIKNKYVDYNTLDLPVVLKTYYHTIRSDGKQVLVELNEGVK